MKIDATTTDVHLNNFKIPKKRKVRSSRRRRLGSGFPQSDIPTLLHLLRTRYERLFASAMLNPTTPNRTITEKLLKLNNIF